MEDERLKAVNPEGVAESGSRKTSRPKHKRSENLSKKDTNDGPLPKMTKAVKRPKGKHGGKKDKTKVTCYNYEKLGHFVRECTGPKKVPSNLVSNFYCFMANQNLNAHPIHV